MGKGPDGYGALSDPVDLTEATERGFASRDGGDSLLFYKLFTEATLWVAADEDIDYITDFGSLRLAEVRLATIDSHGGGQLLVLFSKEELGLGFRAGGHPLIATAGAELITQFASLDLDGVVIDPAPAVTAVITRREILALAEGRDPSAPAERIIGDGVTANDLRPPKIVISGELSLELTDLLFAADGVVGAYLVDLRVAGVMQPRLVIEFDPDNEAADPARLIANIRSSMAPPFEITTTDEREILAGCRLFGRRLF